MIAVLSASLDEPPAARRLSLEGRVLSGTVCTMWMPTRYGILLSRTLLCTTFDNLTLAVEPATSPTPCVHRAPRVAECLSWDLPHHSSEHLP